ncbi:beta-mannosidase [Bacillus sp. AK128]
MKKLILNGEWQMKEAHGHVWKKAVVPGSVMNDLLTHNIIDDPFYRANEDTGLEVASKDYIYSRKFEVDGTWLKHNKVAILFEGIDTLSKISVNGNLVAETDNMHRTYEIDCKNFLKVGENELVVELGSPLHYIKEKQKELPLWGVKDAVDGYPHLRKAHSMFGWDWGPKIPDLGIWRNVYLQAWNVGRLDDVYITQQHESESVWLNIRATTETYNEGNYKVEGKVISPNGEIWTETMDEFGTASIHITDPKLWWPNGYGEQPLYKIEVYMKHGDHVLDQKEYNIGLRTITVRHEPDQWGKSFEFVVNGISIFAMGANYIPEDNILARVTYEKTEKLIRDCVEANFNMIRVWGGGYYPDDRFFDLCDQYGIIVWQDFMFACSVYELNDDFEETIKREVIDNVKRIRHHASLGLWCGNNEIEEAWVYWGDFPNNQPNRKADYIKIFEYIIPALMKELDPQTFYWSSSPSSGGSFDAPRNPDVGDMHYWEVWHGLKPFTEYQDYFFRFCSEFGFQSFPSLKTINSFTLPEDRNIFSYVMEKHQKNGAANGKILFYLSENFLYPKDFDSLLYASQLLQAEAIKYGVEHWRRNRGRCMGSLYWQLNDCWPVASWSSIDYYGRWKALHYFAKRFYSPLLLSIKEMGKQAEIYLTNDTMEDVNGRVEWKLRSNASEIIHQGSIDVTVKSLSAELCTELSFDEMLTERDLKSTYLECQLFTGGDLTSTSTILFIKPKHFEFLDPELSFELIEEENNFELTVNSKNFTKYIQLELRKADCKFSDNYFDLSAGDIKRIIINKDSLSHELTAQEFKDQLLLRSVYHIAN